MKIYDLPDKTRLELHNHVKKNIRKYYKGLKSGSLKYDSFVSSMLKKTPLPSWLEENPHLANDPEFIESLIQYIQNAISRYSQLEKENKYYNANGYRVLSDGGKKAQDSITAIKERQELKKILTSKGYTLSIPAKFLTTTESQYLRDYLEHGVPIPLGWEKVLNYIKKST